MTPCMEKYVTSSLGVLGWIWLVGYQSLNLYLSVTPSCPYIFLGVYVFSGFISVFATGFY